MKKLISLIISLTMLCSIVPVRAEDNISNINMPTSNCELGYIFSVSDNNFDGLNSDDYDGIVVISEELNIYYAQDLKSLKKIAAKFNITDYEENFIIETPDLPEEDFSQEISLFDDGDGDTNEPEPTIEPVSSEKPIETIVPVKTEMPVETAIPETTEEPSVTAIPQETEAPQTTEEPVETETPENTEEPSETIEPTQTETPEETSPPIEPTVEPAPTPNDVLYNWQWYYEAVNANAYRKNNITGKGVKVGIIDSGIRTDREDFEGVDIETGLNVCAYVMNDEDRLYAIMDASNHGTGVAGIIAAKSNNSVGIAGMVDDCTIVPYRMQDSNYAKGVNGVALIRAIQLACDEGCDVVNISQAATLTDDKYINQVVNNAIKNGMIIIAGAGNDGNKEETLNVLSYPAACTNVIGVGAVQPDCEQSKIRWVKSSYELVDPDIVLSGTGTGYYYVLSTIKDLSSNSYVKCDFSTANDSVFISAPGKDMMILSNQSSSEYHLGAGTSYATPIVSAAAIGVKQMRPYVDTDMFKEILKATAVDLDEEGYDVNTGYGMVDFEAIYNYVSEMPETVPEETPEIKIDYANNQLLGFDEEAEYLLNGVSVTPEENSIAIDDTWYGSTISVVRKSRGNGYTDSEAQELNVPAIPDAPTTVSTGYNKISGVTTTMEYKPSASDTWIPCSDGEISDLEAGTYDVRLKASETAFASKTTQIQVENAPQAEDTPNITIDYKNHIFKGFEGDSEYLVNENTVAIANGQLNIAEDWYGNTISIVKKSRGDGYIDSEPQSLNIPTIPDAPTTVSAGYNKINGIKTTMEYKLYSSDTWISCSGTEIANLVAGSYDVRTKATTKSFASKSVQIEVLDLPYVPTTPPLEKEYVIETSVYYDETNHRVVFSYTNNTDNTIYATGVVAVYDTNGILKYIKTVKIFQKGTLNQSFAYNDANCKIKFFIWKDLQSLQPYPDAKYSEYMVSEGE